MSSKDISLSLVDHLNLMRQNGTDYLLIALDPGKNADRADIWYELKNKDSPSNLLQACLGLFTELYDKDELIGSLIGFCEVLDDAYGEGEMDQGVAMPPIVMKKKEKKKP